VGWTFEEVGFDYDFYMTHFYLVDRTILMYMNYYIT
jgi:hypothetical protein